MSMDMTSNKPYLVRAFYDWISDNELTPHIVVDVNVYGVLVPMSYVNDGQIILNISAGAVGTISLGPEAIEFSARFGGKLEHLVVPYGAIAAIYAKENGAGTSLPIEHVEPEEQAPTRATLSEVSSADDNKTAADSDIASDDNEEPKDKPKKGRPGLRVVK